MGCQEVSADICGEKKIYFDYLLYQRGVWERMVVFFLSAVKKMLKDLHIFVCAIMCVCVSIAFCVRVWLAVTDFC